MKKGQDDPDEDDRLRYQVSTERLLSDPDQIRRLQKIDPTLVLWIIERSAREQQARHDFEAGKLALIEAEQKRIFKTDVLALVCGLILASGGMLLSFFLLRAGFTATGGIFGGSAIIFVTIAFLNFRKLPKS